MSAAMHSPGAEAAERAERRWAWIVGGIIFLLVAMMVVTGVHWAAMPPSRVETIDPRTLHMRGEFVESNLGSAVDTQGKVTVRLVAQQYLEAPAPGGGNRRPVEGAGVAVHPQGVEILQAPGEPVVDRAPEVERRLRALEVSVDSPTRMRLAWHHRFSRRRPIYPSPSATNNRGTAA